MGLFEDLILRKNGDNVDSSWWNSITVALRSALPGVKNNIATPATILNNQSSFVSIAGTEFLGIEATSWVLRYEIYRKTDLAERLEIGQLVITYKPIAGTYTVNRSTANDENALNVDNAFNVTSLGVLQYKSDNMSGVDYVGNFSYAITNIFQGGL